MNKNLKHLIGLSAMLVTMSVFTATPIWSQGPLGRQFGFGITLGDPLGGTIKYWTAPDQALVADIGSDYFGSPRIDFDYYWHFNAFRSNVVKLYAGPGLAAGFGNGNYYLWYGHGHDYYFIRNEGGTGIGVHVLIGIDIIPHNSPIELYVQLGLLIGITPAFGASLDAALGIRFYP